jgi:hypothetical protein
VKLIRVAYDGYNRRFKLLDSIQAATLRDGETYMFMDFSEDDLTPDESAGCVEDPESHPRSLYKNQ